MAPGKGFVPVRQSRGLLLRPTLADAAQEAIRVFERHKQKKAERRYQAELARWKEQRNATERRLSAAETYSGEQTTEIMLKPGELRIARVMDAQLIEPRRGRGHWQGRSSGVSVPVGSLGGRSVRYRVGGTRGTYVQGEPLDTAIDTGTVHITNQRVIFEGARQTRECRFDKLLGMRHDDASGQTIFSVSNRQKPTTIAAGSGQRAEFQFWLDLARAHYRGDVADLVVQVKQELAKVEARKPVLTVT